MNTQTTPQTEMLTAKTNPKFDCAGSTTSHSSARTWRRTVDFYANVLGMPLVKTINLPRAMGQHFFFDCGGGDCIAFFWFPNAPEAAPGIASSAALPRRW